MSVRIALFLPSLRGGGAERVMVTLANGFVDRGYTVDLVLTRSEGPYLVDVSPEVRIVNLRARRVLFSLPGLVRYLRREKPSCMLSTLSHANIIAICAKKVAGVPLRLVIREATTLSQSSGNARNLRGRMMGVLAQIFYSWSDMVVAPSHRVARDLRSGGVISQNRVVVIRNPAIRPEIFSMAEEPISHPWFQPGGAKVVVGVGRLTKAKDFATLIRAFALIRSRLQARLVIFGEGEDRCELESLILRLGIGESVALLGFAMNPYKYMKAAAVFVLSSRWEGSPNALIEAAALGVPIVSTNCPGGPMEILQGGKRGMLVPVEDHAALAQAIESVLLGHVPIDTTPWHCEYSSENILDRYTDILQLKAIPPLL